MKTIPTYTSPKMQDAVVQTLNALLTGYVEYLFGIANIGVDDKGFSYPSIYHNDGSSKNVMLFPDNKVKSFGFWEFNGANVLDDDEGVEYSLSFVFWGNLTRIDSTKRYDHTSEIEQNIISVLKANGATDIDYTEDRVFSSYTKYAEESQTLMRPNTGFRISLNIHDFIC